MTPCYSRFRIYFLVTRSYSSSHTKQLKGIPQWNITTQDETKVPLTPVRQIDTKLPPVTKIDSNTINLLERLSLVDCANKKGIKTLEDAIRFADNILHIDTKDVEPMYTVLEDRNLSLRPDTITDGNCRKDILKNSSLTEEDYFVAPGNITITESSDTNENYLFDSNAKVFENSETAYAKEVCCSDSDIDLNVFYYNRSFNEETNASIDPCDDLFKGYNGHLPISVADIYSKYEIKATAHEKEEDSYFMPLSRIELSLTTALPMANALQFFLHWQRKRKMWWSKISTSPGRYVLSDMKYEGDSTSVMILSQFPWGNQIAEEVTVQPSPFTSEKHKNIWAVRSVTSLETALLNLLCDSAVDDISERSILRLHRKMAPYKCAVAIQFADESSFDQLSKLAFLLNQKFRRNGLESYLAADHSKPLEYQLLHSNELGIPFTLILKEETLKSGITTLYNRDTTLQEQVHITDVIGFTEKLFKNF